MRIFAQVKGAKDIYCNCNDGEGCDDCIFADAQVEILDPIDQVIDYDGRGKLTCNLLIEYGSIVEISKSALTNWRVE